MNIFLEISINIENFNFGYTQLIASLDSTINFINNYVDTVYITQNNIIQSIVVKDINISNPIWVKEMLINKINTNNFWLNYILNRLDSIIKIDKNICISDIINGKDHEDCLSEFLKCKEKFISIDNKCRNILQSKSIII